MGWGRGKNLPGWERLPVRAEATVEAAGTPAARLPGSSVCQAQESYYYEGKLRLRRTDSRPHSDRLWIQIQLEPVPKPHHPCDTTRGPYSY